MKTAFAIDFLLERTLEVEMLELLLAGHEDADIYCLAHRPGALQGEVERHRIIASPLSHMVTTAEDLRRKGWLIPSAARQLHVSSDVERLMVISSGWAQVFPTTTRTRKFVWLYQFDDPRCELTGWRNLFRPHHQQVKRQSLKNCELAFSSAQLRSSLQASGEVIAPAFRTEEFPFVPDEQHPGHYPHHLVLMEGMSLAQVKKLTDLARQQQVTLKMLGTEHQLASDEWVEFIGGHCEATTAALSHGARAVWALGKLPFPAGALGAMCCGRPVVVAETPVNREFLGESSGWFATDANLADVLATVERDYLSADRKALRRLGLKWNGRLFKSRMREFSGVVAAPVASSLLT